MQLWYGFVTLWSDGKEDCISAAMTPARLCYSKGEYLDWLLRAPVPHKSFEKLTSTSIRYDPETRTGYYYAYCNYYGGRVSEPGSEDTSDDGYQDEERYAEHSRDASRNGKRPVIRGLMDLFAGVQEDFRMIGEGGQSYRNEFVWKAASVPGPFPDSSTWCVF